MIGDSYIVGLGHRARQGKDYFARWLLYELFLARVDARIMAIADDVKAYCRAVHHMRTKDTALLVNTAGAWVNATGNENFWLDRWRWRVEESHAQVIIAPDVRRLPELEACDMSIRLDRYNEDGTPFRDPERADDPYESMLDGYDDRWRYVIGAVSGDLETLQRQARSAALLIYDSIFGTSHIADD